MIGGDTRTVLRTIADGKIVLGDNVGISNSALVSGGAGIYVGNNVLIGGSCKIYDTDFHPLNYEQRTGPSWRKYISTRKVVLKDGCFIGAH